MVRASQISAFKSAREDARRLAERSEDRMSFAQGFVAGAVRHYFPRAARGPVEPLHHPLAEAIGALAAQMDPTLAAYMLGTVYTVMLPTNFRTQHGVFYTPPPVADRLLDLAACDVCWKTARVADLSCGGGAFLAPVAQRMIAARRWRSDAAAAEHLRRHLRGIELDSFSAWMSDVFLNVAFARVFTRTRLYLNSLVLVGDSLATPVNDLGTFDLVVGNPPYGRITLSEALREKFSRSLYGHANLYGLFTDLALRLLSPIGAVAYITPASFLGGQYFERLRGLLAEQAPPAAIDFLESREGVFADVLQETVLAVFKRNSGRNIKVSYTRVSETDPASTEDGGMASLPLVGSAPWILPRAPHHAALLAAARALPCRLSDYGYKVSTGPLVWNRHKDRIHSALVPGAVPIVWAEAVCPRNTGRFTLKAEDRNHAPWYLPSKTSDPNIVRTPCVLVQRTTAKEQPRRIIAAALPGTVFKRFGALAIENHLNMIRAKPAQEVTIDIETLAVLLNSEAVDQVFRCISGSTAVSAYELEALPLPNPDDAGRLVDMIRNGRTHDAIQRFIASLYAHVRIGAAA